MRAMEPANCKKYGIPLYGASWISDNNYLVFAGGGGEGRSGIPNALLLARFDFESNCLNDQPVAKLGTGSDLPYRMAVHPGGDGVICSLPKSCRCFEWDTVQSTDSKKLGLKPSDKVIDELEDVGQQLALIFNNDGSVLALGGEANAASGMAVDDECKLKFSELKTKRNYRYIIFKIEAQKVVVEKVGSPEESYEDFSAALPADECRYSVFDFDFTTEENCQKSKIFFIAW